MCRRAATCLTAIATVVICPSAQTPPSAQFRAGVTLVELEVTAVDGRGLPVAGLAKADFSVLENGSARRVVNAIEIGSVASTATELSQLAQHPPESQLVTIILDDAQIPGNPRTAQQARALAQTVIQSLSASDHAAVVFTRSTHQSVDFTTNHSKLIETVKAFTPAHTSGSAPTAMSATLYEIRNALNVLESVVRHVGTMAGRRKAIFYVSTGVALPPQGTQAFNEVIQAMRRVFDVAQAGNVMIYGLDPGGLEVGPGTRAENSTSGSGAAGGLRSRHEFLLMLAENTGGRSIVDRNNPEKAVTTLLAEHNHYYHVAYESPLADSEPPRQIAVKVSRRGAAARFRSMNTPWRP